MAPLQLSWDPKGGCCDNQMGDYLCSCGIHRFLISTDAFLALIIYVFFVCVLNFGVYFAIFFYWFLTSCLSFSSQKHVVGPLGAAFLLCLQVKAFKERLRLAQRFLLLSGSSRVGVSDLRPCVRGSLRRHVRACPPREAMELGS